MSVVRQHFGDSAHGRRRPAEQIFADLLNGLRAGDRGAGESAVDGRDPQDGGDQSWDGGEPDFQRQAGDGPEKDAAEAEPAGSDECAAAVSRNCTVVRPYSWTAGRTRSESELRVETMVSTTRRADDASLLLTGDQQMIAKLCGQPRSVAEVAASLVVPLRVAGVLLGDMTERGLLTVHRTARADGSRAHIALMERVLSGLRRL